MPYRWLLFDWGDTLMSEDGPADLPMALWPEVRALDGAVAVLSRLSRRHGIAVATNASVSDRTMIERALAPAALGTWVSEVFCYRELGVKKAEAAFWDAVVARLGVTRDEILMIGDDLTHDVLAPRRHGIAAVWFNWKKAPVPDAAEFAIIDRLADLPALVDAGGRAGTR